MLNLMICISSFLLLPVIINAISSMNPNISSVSEQKAQAAADSSYDSSYSAGLFIDCPSYSASLLASSNATLASITPAITTPALIRPATSTSIMPFEKYWCDNHFGDVPANTPDSFPNNGTLEGWFWDLNASDKEFCLSLEKANYNSWAANPTPVVIGNITEQPYWAPTLTPPCCDTFCNIDASAAQLYFWPTPAPTPNVTTVIGADGFTYTSPLVYIVYKTISAYGQCGNIGPTYASLTFSYNQSDIYSFDSGSGEKGNLNYASLFSNCTARAADYSYPQPDCVDQLSTNWMDSPSCTSQVDSIASLGSFDQLHCYPYLNYPSGLQAANPAWSTCVDTNFGGHFASVFDPPRALTAAPALGPVPTQTPSLPGAAPASPATGSAPLKTAPPKVTGPVGGIPNNLPAHKSPPAGNDPPVGSDPLSDEHPPEGNDPPAGNSPLPGNVSPPVNAPKDPSKGTSDPSKDAPGAFPQAVEAAPSEAATKYNTAAALTPFATTIQGHVIQVVSSSGGIVFDGQSIAPGEDSTFISGTPIALQPNGDLMLGTTTYQHIIPGPFPTSNLVFNVGSQTLTLFSNRVVGAGQTLKPHDPAISVGGTIVSLGRSELQVGSSTIPLAPGVTLPAPVIIAAGRLATLLTNGVAIASATLTTNAPAITVAGTQISLGDNGLIIGSSTIPLSPRLPKSIITIENQIYAVSRIAGEVVIAGTTLQVGQPPITISGSAIALKKSGLVINGTSTVSIESIYSVYSGQSMPNHIGEFIFAGLNGGPAAKTSPAGATSSNPSQANNTGAAVGIETFRGRSAKVAVRLFDTLTEITAMMLLVWFFS